MFIGSKAKNILFVSLGVMLVVLLVTSSIWMHAAQNPGPLEAVKDRAIVSLIFVLLAIGLSLASFFKLKTDGLDKHVFILLVMVFISLTIAALVPMNDQNTTYKSIHKIFNATNKALEEANKSMNGIQGLNNYTDIQMPAMQIPDSANLFPVVLTFWLVPGLFFVFSSYAVSKEEMLFL